MTQVCTTCESAGHLRLLTLLYDNLLSFVFFLYSHPLHLAYLLYFSPYFLQLLSFLFPLLLSTSIFLLIFSLHSILEGEAAAICLLDQLGSVVVATIGNVFEWEFEAMGELYKNVGLTCKVEEEDPAEICIENSASNEHLDSYGGSGDRNRMELPSKNSEKCELLENHVGIEPQTPSMGEVYEISNLNCDTREDPPNEISPDRSKRSEILESRYEIGDQVNIQACTFVPQTPDRISEILASSPLARRAKQRGAASESVSRGGSVRSGSMRITGEFYKHSSLNCEVVEGPNERFSRSHSEKGSSFMSRNPSRRHETPNDCSSMEGLQREGSMRKGKEWRKTLACKLYEERMTFKLREQRSIVVEGAEEMDLLWEAYEADADKPNKFKNKEKNGKKEACIEEEEEEEEEESVGQLCCLQALRLSTGKMNLGVGRPNLAKISKVFKGIGLFHRSGSRRSRNKVESS